MNFTFIDHNRRKYMISKKLNILKTYPITVTALSCAFALKVFWGKKALGKRLGEAALELTSFLMFLNSGVGATSLIN